MSEATDHVKHAARRVCLVLPLFVAALSGSLRAATLSGVVRDATGRVVPGARVSASSPSGDSETTSSADGRFSIPDVSVPATVRVEKPGFSTGVTTWAGTGEVSVVLAPGPVRQQVVVTATRTEVAAGDIASAVSAMGAEELAAQPAIQIDTVLRQVPGFSLFRRADSRTANPTTQGVSLRGLGATGASRAMVLFDGLPLTDPFGGWVYWDRVPMQEVASVEVFRGGGSSLYGSGALAGVVNFRRETVAMPMISADLSAGGQGTRAGSAKISAGIGAWALSASAQGLTTEGYIPVAREARGPVDAPANVRYGNSWLKAGRKIAGGSVFVSGDLFNESRQNGTLLQTNNTRLAEGAAGADLAVAGGNLALRGYGSAQRYNQTFSSISLDRAAEALVRLQAVPAQQLGGSAQWVRSLSANNVLAVGADVRQIRGHTDEIVLVQSVPTTRVVAGGHQTLGGGFVEDMLQLGRVSLTMAARVDTWRNYDAYSNAFPLGATGIAEMRDLNDKTSVAFSPSLGAVVRLSSMFSLTASGYGAFRSPTLNELYRTFRQGNVQTLANEALNAERLRGVEGGLTLSAGRVHGRIGYYWSTIRDAIGNRTLQVTPELITRQRQNIGSLDAQGVEMELSAALPRGLWVRTSYAFSHSIVGESLESSLEGRRIPQVPRHAVSSTIGYTGPRWYATAVGRYVDRQYDDDLNRLSLPGYFVTDLFVAYRFLSGVDAYLACENLLDRSYVTARTPAESLGSGILVRAGVKLAWPLKKR